MEERRIGNIYGFDGGNFAGNVYDKDSCSPTIRTYQGGNQQPCVVAMRGRNLDNCIASNLLADTHGYENSHIATQYRVRKLTPRECGRLMGVSDEDISKMAAVNSNTQLYKQFGNSIVVDVMCAMFRNLNINQK
jgi:site-specific DNA-cytosine methylase